MLLTGVPSALLPTWGNGVARTFGCGHTVDDAVLLTSSPGVACTLDCGGLITLSAVLLTSGPRSVVLFAEFSFT